MRGKRLLALTLLLVLAATLLAACGGDPAIEAASGTYVGQYTKLVGDETKTEEEFSLDLTPDGKGVHHRDTMDFKVTWTLEGEDFSMDETFIGDPIHYTGTLKDGELHLYNGDPTDIWTYEYFYKKQ